MVGIFSAPFGGILSGWLGRRKLIIFAAPIVVCGWMVIGLAQNKEMLYAGRIMTSGQQKGLFKMTPACIPPDVFRNPLCIFDETWCVISILP